MGLGCYILIQGFCRKLLHINFLIFLTNPEQSKWIFDNKCVDYLKKFVLLTAEMAKDTKFYRTVVHNVFVTKLKSPSIKFLILHCL